MKARREGWVVGGRGAATKRVCVGYERRQKGR